ncbi:hypothetical protein [Egicoccus halophilus]|uniref:Uncharacterized protein n=1 Tax=Egicoccus halophilus TaxID=1670830 RepID=A0A8J3ETB0_9ACTN|nr:hypothetical protein [Egicoccus halophilus]GGI09163.1 hypothetical protein GCM10011354_32710 [Egicoccus halophilus]
MIDTVTVTYRTLGLTRRTEIPLPWTFGWTDEPQNWPQISRRDELADDTR